MSKYEIESLIKTMNNYDDLASKAKAKADAIRDTLKSEMLRLGAEELTAGAYIHNANINEVSKRRTHGISKHHSAVRTLIYGLLLAGNSGSSAADTK